MKVECVVPSCSARQEANFQRLNVDGWRRLKAITERNPPPVRSWREYLGWCPDCTKRFSVQEKRE